MVMADSGTGGARRLGVLLAAVVFAASAAGAIAAAPAAAGTLNVTVTGGGTVTADRGGIDCRAGDVGTCSYTYPDAAATEINFTASPASGWASESWGGDCAAGGVSTTCTLVLAGSGTRSVSKAFRDAAPPTVFLNAPANLTRLSGHATLAASAFDGQAGVQRVEFLVGTASRTLTAAGTSSVKVKLERKARRKLAGLKKVVLVIRVRATDAAGNRAARTKRVQLVR